MTTTVQGVGARLAEGEGVPDTAHGVILYLEDISVTFDGYRALTDLSLYLMDGELRCVIGPNGAGKTTLMDVITGRTAPDKGTAWFGQRQDLLRLREHEIARAGIGRKFQKPTVFEAHTAFENLELAMKTSDADAGKGVWRSLTARLSGEQRDRIEAVLETIALTDRRGDRAGALSHGQKQWLEIGMLLVQDPRLLLIDEPVAGMTHHEIERTAELLQRLAGEHTIMVVEHDMDFIRSIARTVTVLHEGSVLAEGSMAQVQDDPRVRAVYLGD